MALDVFVMSLSRYLAGDFTTATERFAREQGIPYSRLGGEKPDWSIDDAREYVRSLRMQLSLQLGLEICWRDEGETVFAEQFSFDAWHALRAFAADLTRPLSGFRFDGESHRHPALHPIWLGEVRTPYEHLIIHSDNNGFYLPTDFDGPFVLEMYEGVDEGRQPRVGSSLGLLRELNDLGRRLGLTRDCGEEGWTEQFVRDDPLELPKRGWTFMRSCARLSVSHGLPIIFDG